MTDAAHSFRTLDAAPGSKAGATAGVRSSVSGAGYRMSDAAPLYALIILLGGGVTAVVAVVALWRLLWRVVWSLI
jgi:hypothetical protein